MSPIAAGVTVITSGPIPHPVTVAIPQLDLAEHEHPAPAASGGSAAPPRGSARATPSRRARSPAGGAAASSGSTEGFAATRSRR